VYSLISAHEIVDNGTNVKLLKLRNPWGCGEWNGDWSDNSNKWTDEFKQQLGVEN
jgi:Calpain family cysteine protease